MKKTIKIFSDLKNRTKINNIPNWSKEKILNCLDNYHIELIFSKERIQECEIYFGDLVEASYVNRMLDLKWIHFSSTGVNRAFIPEIINRNIEVTYSPDAFTNSVTILALGFLCTFSRGLHKLFKLRDENKLSRENFDNSYSEITDLKGEKVLIVGYGRIGKKLGEVLSLLGMKISVIKSDNNKGISDFVEKVYTLDHLNNAVKSKSYIINLF